MNPKYDIYEEIDRYLNEELSEAELAQFNQKLASNAEFRSIVDAQKIANEVIIDQEMIKLKERMNKDMNQDNNGSSQWGKIILLSVVVTSAALYYTYRQYSATKTEENKTTAAVTSPQIPAIRSNSNNATTPEAAEKTTVVSTTPSDASNSQQQTTLVNTGSAHPIEPIKITTQENTITSVTPADQENKLQTPAVTGQLDKVNCETVKIVATARVDYGSDNDQETTVIIDPSSVRGGTAPYSYSLDQSAFQNSNRFENIKDGSYHLHIKDQNNCITELKKTIFVKKPVKEIDDAFAPSQGEHWKYPLRAHADATLTIQSKTGALVYSTTISGGYPSEWDGRSNAGVELESGNYYFVIQYAANDIVKGHISIVR